MPTVKVLIDGVGGYNAGDIVVDAPVGLVEMAESGTTNAATGQLVAEIADDLHDVFQQLQTKAKEMKIRGYAKMTFEQLDEAVKSAEPTAIPQAAEPAKEAVSTDGEPNPNK